MHESNKREGELSTLLDMNVKQTNIKHHANFTPVQLKGKVVSEQLTKSTCVEVFENARQCSLLFITVATDYSI